MLNISFFNRRRRRGTAYIPRKAKGGRGGIWAAAGSVLAVAVIFTVVNSPAFIGVSAMRREFPIYCVKRDNKAVSLTFDAAWGDEDTGRLIEIFEQYGVRVTFFVVGEWAEKYPESARALREAGHEVMNHSDDHAHFTGLSAAEIAANVNACNNKIEAATGERPTLFRAPYGEYNDNVIKTVKSLGMDTIQWNIDSLDWKGISASEITRRVTEKAEPGSIALFHNAAKHTPEALPAIIEFFMRDGYSIVPVSELLLKGEYTIDHAGKQIPA
ncbi:MAG: polysaccharide deacetylase family protein [Oscillospiraceae bacterium]|jgi:peptidoglycan/xylan/chitin deacetylase (PgdA/CDA1 family)|nr:polysaccharide deacetylase family protein [Oscillospiraceae bacterium]